MVPPVVPAQPAVIYFTPKASEKDKNDAQLVKNRLILHNMSADVDFGTGNVSNMHLPAQTNACAKILKSTNPSYMNDTLLSAWSTSNVKVAKNAAFDTLAIHRSIHKIESLLVKLLLKGTGSTTPATSFEKNSTVAH